MLRHSGQSGSWKRLWASERGEAAKQTYSPFLLVSSLTSLLVYTWPRRSLVTSKKTGLSLCLAAHCFQSLPWLLYPRPCFLSPTSVKDANAKTYQRETRTHDWEERFGWFMCLGKNENQSRHCFNACIWKWPSYLSLLPPSFTPSLWDMVTFIPHWSLAPSVGKRNNEVVIILSPPPEYWDCRCTKWCLVICGVGDGAQGFLHAKWTLPYYPALEKPRVSVFLIGSKRSYRTFQSRCFLHLDYRLFIKGHTPCVEWWGSPAHHFTSERGENLVEKVSLPPP